ncbi:thioredoxin domain-containing protein [Candidatus Gracilibacteria bacterium]|nr:thioredoxin domain-containing protein [Candidatus Gracilibacteria bacterium]
MKNLSHTKGAGALTNFLLIILIALSVVQIFFLTGNSFNFPSFKDVTFFGYKLPFDTDSKVDDKTDATDTKVSKSDVLGLKKALLEIEYNKVGGKENYEIITAAQKKSLLDPNNPNGIAGLKRYVAAGQPDAVKSDKEKVEKVLKDAVIEGNKDADIVVVEYSDTECPFCIRQAAQFKIGEKLLAKYQDKIGFAFKNHRGVNHKGTQVKALSILCAKKVGSDEAYAKMHKGILDGSVNGVYEIARLPDLAKEAGLDVAKWQKCVDEKETLTQFNTQTAEGKSFGLSGTPGTLIINKKTGKYATVSGSAQLSAFVQKIDSLMK